MSITTTGNLGPMILQSLAPAMLYTPTPMFNYITVADKVSMPANGGTTCRFMRPRALTPPTVQLGNQYRFNKKDLAKPHADDLSEMQGANILRSVIKEHEEALKLKKLLKPM